MAITQNERIVYALANDGKGKPTLIIAVPKGAWDYMKDGLTHHVDLEQPNGIRMQFILFGCDNAAHANALLGKAGKAANFHDARARATGIGGAAGDLDGRDDHVDDLVDLIGEAFMDGDGKLYANTLRHHLSRHQLAIVQWAEGNTASPHVVDEAAKAMFDATLLRASADHAKIKWEDITSEHREYWRSMARLAIGVDRNRANEERAKA